MLTAPWEPLRVILSVIFINWNLLPLTIPPNGDDDFVGDFFFQLNRGLHKYFMNTINTQTRKWFHFEKEREKKCWFSEGNRFFFQSHLVTWWLHWSEKKIFQFSKLSLTTQFLLLGFINTPAIRLINWKWIYSPMNTEWMSFRCSSDSDVTGELKLI